MTRHIVTLMRFLIACCYLLCVCTAMAQDSRQSAPSTTSTSTIEDLKREATELLARRISLEDRNKKISAELQVDKRLQQLQELRADLAQLYGQVQVLDDGARQLQAT